MTKPKLKQYKFKEDELHFPRLLRRLQGDEAYCEQLDRVIVSCSEHTRTNLVTFKDLVRADPIPITGEITYYDMLQLAEHLHRTCKRPWFEDLDKVLFQSVTPEMEDELFASILLKPGAKITATVARKCLKIYAKEIDKGTVPPSLKKWVEDGLFLIAANENFQKAFKIVEETRGRKHGSASYSSLSVACCSEIYRRQGMSALEAAQNCVKHFPMIGVRRIQSIMKDVPIPQNISVQVLEDVYTQNHFAEFCK